MPELTADLGNLSSREFRIGKSLDKAVKVFFRNAIPFSLLALVAWLPVGFLFYNTLNLPPQERSVWQFIAFPIGGLLQLVATAAIIQATFQDLRGRRVHLGDSIKHGLKRFFPLIGGGLLVGLGALLGFLLLVVPGVLLLLRWYSFASVCVVEKKGPFSSMERSAELTQGNRWKLFAIFIILIIAGAVIGKLILIALVASFPPLTALAVQGVWQGAWGAFNNVLGVVIYLELRHAKEGADIENIASVFD